MLANRYFIGKALRKGGFGITYVGCDTRLNKKVAIKEYFPSAVANRDGKETQYVRISDEKGDDLDRYIKKNGKMSFKKAFAMMGPIMLSLRAVHKRGLIHRDITPANVKIQPDETAILLDFGAAREYEGSENAELSVILKPGYAPPEQYQSRGLQGLWTDVYGICATMYKMITGVTPVNSIDRMLNDTLKKPSEMDADITPAEEAALFHGLAVAKDVRTASMQELFDEMHKSMTAQNTPKEEDEDEEESLESRAEEEDFDDEEDDYN